MKAESLADIIIKVKQLQDLTAEEELIYLIHIEGNTPEEAKRKVVLWYEIDSGYQILDTGYQILDSGY